MTTTSANGSARLTKSRSNGSTKVAIGIGHRNGTNGRSNGPARTYIAKAPARTMVAERPAPPRTDSVPETVLSVPANPGFVQLATAWEDARPPSPWDSEKRYILPLLLAGLIGVLGVVVAGTRDNSAGAATPPAPSSQADQATNEAFPPASDVVVSQCVVDSQGLMRAHGNVVNHINSPANYMIGVSFNGAGTTKLGDGFAVVNDVAPGERATWTIGSYLPPGGADHTCDVTRVERGTP